MRASFDFVALCDIRYCRGLFSFCDIMLKKEADMETSIFIARIFGMCYLILGAGLVFNRKAFQQIMNDFCKNAALIFLGGMFALVFGSVLSFFGFLAG